jgi:hypothetical protein
MAQHDYETDVRAAAQIEMLMNINAEQLKLLQELRGLRGNPPGGSGESGLP